ncbi:MAG: CBS domain-containing protein [Beijerinckiaceae bacterium]|nr:MAG: CBS domain-containing protein [Beijerinckiaceae bacterium]
MSLEQFRRTRMVILNRSSTAYQAARAMEDNHIGAVLVSDPPWLTGIVTDRDLALAVLGGGLDPKTTRLDEMMSEEVITCDISGDLDEVVHLMREYGVRRIPLVEGARPVGLITFDDLVVDGTVSPAALRDIVTAQLEAEAPQKPAGMLHPGAGTTAQSLTRALMRAKARAEATYDQMVQAVAAATGLERARSERALLITTCMLCQRLTLDKAQNLIAQFPSMLQSQLDQCLEGPDRLVSRQAIEDELSRSLGVSTEGASEIIRGVSTVISESVSAGQIQKARGQLPQEMKELFSASAPS